MQTYVKPNNLDTELYPWPISDYLKILKNALGMDLFNAVKGTGIKCTTIEYILFAALGTEKWGTLKKIWSF